MKFCILSPIAGLRRYSTLSNRHLVLPQILNEHYRNFYAERRKAGDFIILDNGAWEGNCNWDLLLRAMEFYHPHVVVLPDYLLQPWEKTYHEAITFLDTYYNTFNCQWGFCPQSDRGNVMGFLEGLVRALDDTRIDWIFLPRALATHISNDPLMRVNCCKWLKRRGKSVHALGMLSGSIAELVLLRDAGCNSIDSNAPVWRGWHGVQLGDTSWKPGQPIDYERFKELPGYDIDRIILNNLEACGVNTIHARTTDRIKGSAGAAG